MKIVTGCLSDPRVVALLSEHLDDMRARTPPEDVHALDIEGLGAAEITFYSAWDGADVLGCGALKEIEPGFGEIKSMRTANAHLRKGVARAILAHIIAEARQRNYERLNLETGSSADFAAAHSLYASFGFAFCGPFGDYKRDTFSRFMTLRL